MTSVEVVASSDVGGQLAEPEEELDVAARGGDPHGTVMRGVAAVCAGIVAGALLPSSLEDGFSHGFPGEREQAIWTTFFWGEHWALRAVASWLATLGAGLLVGVLARRRGALLAAVAALPGAIVWLAMVLLVWVGYLPLTTLRADDMWMGDAPLSELSIGNRLLAIILAATSVPIGAWAGRQGALIGGECGYHFDSRRFSLLGIRWFHYLWLPVLIHLLIQQAAWAGLYEFEWFRRTWQSGFSMFSSLVPTVFTLMLWGTLVLMWRGASRAYRVLAGFEMVPRARGRAMVVLKYGIGAFALAAVLQAGIALLHLGLVKLFDRG